VYRNCFEQGHFWIPFLLLEMLLSGLEVAALYEITFSDSRLPYLPPLVELIIYGAVFSFAETVPALIFLRRGLLILFFIFDPESSISGLKALSGLGYEAFGDPFGDCFFERLIVQLEPVWPGISLKTAPGSRLTLGILFMFLGDEAGVFLEEDLTDLLVLLGAALFGVFALISYLVGV